MFFISWYCSSGWFLNFLLLLLSSLPPQLFLPQRLGETAYCEISNSCTDTLAGSIPARRSLARQQMLLWTSNCFNKPGLRISAFETFKAFSPFLFLSCYSRRSWSGVKSKCDTISLAWSIKIANSIVSLSWNAVSVCVWVWKQLDPKKRRSNKKTATVDIFFLWLKEYLSNESILSF